MGLLQLKPGNIPPSQHTLDLPNQLAVAFIPLNYFVT